MKIAAITDDGKTISQHFGRASYYLVVSVKDNQIVSRELREKLGHVHFSNEPHEPDPPGQPHGFGPAAHDRHTRMADAIKDCQVLLCRGMGRGAYQGMQELNIRPVVTDIELIDEAVAAYLEDKLVDRVDKLH